MLYFVIVSGFSVFGVFLEECGLLLGYIIVIEGLWSESCSVNSGLSLIFVLVCSPFRTTRMSRLSRFRFLPEASDTSAVV